MTFRSRPAANRPRNWEERDRRSALYTIGFGVTVAAALLLLAIAFGVSWYGDHLAAAATVNGQTISKDALRRQVAINTFRLDYQERRIRTLLTAGRIRTSDAENRLAILDQRAQQINTISLEQLIDGRIMEELAAREGVVVTDADVDAGMAEEATTPELRHAWVIAVEPTLGEGESTPSDTSKANARAAVEKALADLRAGKSWDEVAKAVSTDATKDQAGDLGFVDENAVLDEAFTDALFAVAVNTPTDVVEGDDGAYRIGRVTEVIAPVVDATLETEIGGEGIELADFRAAVRREAVRTKLNDAIVARATAASPQRRVAQIYMQASDSETGPGAIRVRHILYSPNDDPQNAATVAETDPAWAQAEEAAKAAYAKLKANPDLFDSIARAESDEGAAATSGGKLPYFSSADQIDEAFALSIFRTGLQPGQLLDPVKSSFGWHVIQVMHGPTDREWAAKLKAAIEGGQDFAKLARDNSDAAEAAEGGEIGWVARGQLQQELEDAIFATKAGAISEPLVVDGDGTYLFKVFEEKTREPDADQRQILEQSAFPIWYSKEKTGFTITRDTGLTGGA